jgi:CRISPR-associated protein Cmr4
MQTKILYLFTRTPLHVGAGASVGAIDQPVQRERHTGFPIIPASSLKGSLADQWPVTLRNDKNEPVRLLTKKEGDKPVIDQIDSSGAAWLFGSDDAHVSFAGSLIFSEARVLAFPIRSAKGSYAWITCPLMLERAKRDGVLFGEIPQEPGDDHAIFKPDGPLALDGQIVLEDYAFNSQSGFPMDLAAALAGLIDDELFHSIKDRLVILSNGMMSHFATTACEVAQHVRISDETGTAEHTGLFNQENVPSDTLFYSVLGVTPSRIPVGGFAGKSAGEALVEFSNKLTGKAFQFGGDASTGLGWCSLSVAAVCNRQA